MKKLMFGLLFLLGACGPVYITPVPGIHVVATVSLTDYSYAGGFYYYYNDCGPVYYYSDGSYDAACTYVPDHVITSELIHIGYTLSCPGPGYRVIEYVNGGYDMMDYSVDCE